MKVAELLAERRENWRELEAVCIDMESKRKKKMGAAAVARFASLYRGACADLALADAYHLPPNTVGYLHQLVARAHNQLYRARTFQISNWTQELLVDLPQRLYHDNSLRLAFVLFWGFFLATMFMAYVSPGFAEKIIGRDQLIGMEEMHANSISGNGINAGAASVGFYIQHNTSIGLQCFAFGLLLGVGGLFITISNGVLLGTIFGYMATTSVRENFFQFVTAHGPFELTAIVICSAAGMRLGFAIIDTQGMTRYDSLRLAGREAMPAAALGMILFFLAACIEGLISPSTLPYAMKATIAVISSAILVFYFVLLGNPGGNRIAT
jgi:uncharacterized membrane protein SpoIIM required for sporulation